MTERGVSTVVSYVLVLGIVAVLSASLVGSFGPFVADQQESTARSTLTVFGNDLATDLESADRLSRETDGKVVLSTRLPVEVGGSPYRIEIAQTGSGAAEITLRATDFDATATVTVRTKTPVVERTGGDALDGGPLRIVYDSAAEELVVRNE